MDDNHLVEKILQSLVELEKQGELVLTTNFGSNVARYSGRQSTEMGAHALHLARFGRSKFLF